MKRERDCRAVIPAEAGIQGFQAARGARSSMREPWIPAFAGMTA
jgi:hypothetical protein